MSPRYETILLPGIQIDKDRLPLREKQVERLMASIKEIGLLEPIIVCRRRKTSPSLLLVAGRHRLEACKRLKHKSIWAIVENEDSDAVDRWRALAEIDENLVRSELTPALRAKLAAKRKAAYIALHPETKQGGAPGKKGGKGGKAKGSKDAKSASLPFAEDTATKTGKSKRTIAQDTARADALGSDIDRVVGTSLDKGTELDALAKLPPDERSVIIERAEAGEDVSASRVRKDKKDRARVAVRAPETVYTGGPPALVPVKMEAEAAAAIERYIEHGYETTATHCSFCRKSTQYFVQVGPLLVGPGGVCICDACVADIIAKEDDKLTKGHAITTIDRGPDALALMPCSVCHGTGTVEIIQTERPPDHSEGSEGDGDAA